MADRGIKAFFSPSRYQNGWIVAVLAGIYLVVTALILWGAAQEYLAGEAGDGSFMSGFAFMATMPLSFVVLGVAMAIDSARGIPMADQDATGWTLIAFAVCALINGFLFWVVCRGSRIHRDQREPRRGLPWPGEGPGHG